MVLSTDAVVVLVLAPWQLERIVDDEKLLRVWALIVRVDNPAAPLQPISSLLHFQNNISCISDYCRSPWPENSVHLNQYVKDTTPEDKLVSK